MGKKSMLAMAGLAICILLTACGSGEDELSKAAFIKQADAICASAYRQAQNLKNTDQSWPSRLVRALNKDADEIEALNGPSHDADQIEAVVDGTREAATAIEANEENVVKAEPPVEKAETLAKAYGLEACLLP